MRSGKFYRKNEAEVMKTLGLCPTPNSGSGWVIKEDGQNDDVICQLKSTDAQSISIKKKDIDILNIHALQSHKTPVFAIQFLSDDSVYLLVRPEDLQGLNEILTGERTKARNYSDLFSLEQEQEEQKENKKRIISGSKNGRDSFYKEKERLWRKKNGRQ